MGSISSHEQASSAMYREMVKEYREKSLFSLLCSVPSRQSVLIHSVSRKRPLLFSVSRKRALQFIEGLFCLVYRKIGLFNVSRNRPLFG